MMKNLVKISLLMLRIFVGWHFLYEGLIKLVQGDWSSEAYLKGSIGFLSGFYHWMASDPGVVQVIDFPDIFCFRDNSFGTVLFCISAFWKCLFRVKLRRALLDH